ncbi:MAG: helix-turn-helix transcriptional regulator [Planctomycetota bacterium]|nr:helix-turn-helix transcriptional regulator [Planctomycetota bacterium]
MERLNIINNIRRLRFENGEMTQRALAEKVGVTRQTILAIEKAKYSPTLELAVLIARALGTTLDEVFVVEDSEESTDESGGKGKE